MPHFEDWQVMSPMKSSIITDEFKNVVVKLQVLTSSRYENIYFIVFRFIIEYSSLRDFGP
jgi:hypothetical protein